MCQKKSRFPFKVTGFLFLVRQAAGSYAAWFDRLTNPTKLVP